MRSPLFFVGAVTLVNRHLQAITAHYFSQACATKAAISGLNNGLADATLLMSLLSMVTRRKPSVLHRLPGWGLSQVDGHENACMTSSSRSWTTRRQAGTQDCALSRVLVPAYRPSRSHRAPIISETAIVIYRLRREELKGQLTEVS
ncbi:hypothetical protein DAEQUDRAFT_258281 [Daedalea quercina L-15889]|uniref:Uncharacterized protein n=1 Tax=Daedalea quercina L-15889 TaxID=1314783 RepID=A0A165QJV1_9APHY|nr:hypothetical protein DAEQUDRAFT_258281 [Daedalea quercina L-15889]